MRQKLLSIRKFTSVIAAVVVSVVALAAALTGCATSQRTENLLAASGFKVIPAATPEQLQHLKTLPAGKISFVKRNGQVYFVYPDLAHQQLYVGRNSEYDAYQALLVGQQQEKVYGQIATDNRVASEANLQSQALSVESDPTWLGSWGVWGPMTPWGVW